MLQRNVTDHPLDVMAIPATVQPGDTVDWPDRITGFEPVAEDQAAVDPVPAKAARKSPAAGSKDAD